MNIDDLQSFVQNEWATSILPQLEDYIRIPNLSPTFDAQWEERGAMEEAAALAQNWCEANLPVGAQVSLRRLPGRTPLLFIDVPGSLPGTTLLYGHFDKQPDFTGWEEGLGPRTPVIRDGRLYGRGGADDGYAVFSCLTALNALQRQDISHGRCVVLIEFSEESGSVDLPHHIDALGAALGTPDLVICLDAECGNYDQLWCTTSLRGNLIGTLSIDVLTEGVHSGAASGIVPSSFRVLRALLDRLEDPATGQWRLDQLRATVPGERREQADAAAMALGELVRTKFPWANGAELPTQAPAELLLANTWDPTLSVTGADGLPPLATAGNVLRPRTVVKLSLRLPPTVSAEHAAAQVKDVLEREPPAGSVVRFDVDAAMSGWNAPEVAPWLHEAMNGASEQFFGAPSMYMGTGGSIPFMGMLGARFPGVQFLVTGVLGPSSNAHGPNEFLHLTTAERITCCVAQVLAAAAQHALATNH